MLRKGRAYSRTREIDIRLALGSDARGILRLVLNEGVLLVALGLAPGLSGALPLRGAIASQLYGIGALDPMVISIAVVRIVAGRSFTILCASIAHARRVIGKGALSNRPNVRPRYAPTRNKEQEGHGTSPGSKAAR